MEKINIAELLKDCPKGMELNCTMYESVEFDYIEQSTESAYPIHCLMKTNEGYCSLVFTYNGCSDRHPNAKCVIFPKGKTTWKGFVPPFDFKDGDIIVDTLGGIHIMQNSTTSYCYFDRLGILDKTKTTCVRVERLATEEEKEKLFQAIKKEGYLWNTEAKTLEKLIEPKFKVGDRIQSIKCSLGYTYNVIEVKESLYVVNKNNTNENYHIDFEIQDNWELVPNKFDISTLKPFESRVLVRSTDDDIWRPAIYGFTDSDRYYVVGGIYWKQCIPYEGNEHLRGTTNDCDEYYKLVNHGRFRIVEN